jgi:hypothetical protein
LACPLQKGQGGEHLPQQVGLLGVLGH